MATEKQNAFSFERLTNSNYSAWSFKMQMYLIKESCWDTIEHVGDLEEIHRAKDRKAWSYIILAVDDTQHIHLKGTKGGREAWEKLKDFHLQPTLSAHVRVLK
jgi:hypothetical protein